jgi:hypothetical protein
MKKAMPCWNPPYSMFLISGKKIYDCSQNVERRVK